MEKKLTYTPVGVCAKAIDITVEGGVIKHISFTRGCDGNLKGVARLSEGKKIEEVIATLEGITCGNKATSCPDQLAQALKSMQ